MLRITDNKSVRTLPTSQLRPLIGVGSLGTSKPSLPKPSGCQQAESTVYNVQNLLRHHSQPLRNPQPATTIPNGKYPTSTHIHCSGIGICGSDSTNRREWRAVVAAKREH